MKLSINGTRHHSSATHRFPARNDSLAIAIVQTRGHGRGPGGSQLSVRGHVPAHASRADQQLRRGDVARALTGRLTNAQRQRILDERAPSALARGRAAAAARCHAAGGVLPVLAGARGGGGRAVARTQRQPALFSPGKVRRSPGPTQAPARARAHDSPTPRSPRSRPSCRPTRHALPTARAAGAPRTSSPCSRTRTC